MVKSLQNASLTKTKTKPRNLMKIETHLNISWFLQKSLHFMIITSFDEYHDKLRHFMIVGTNRELYEYPDKSRKITIDNVAKVLSQYSDSWWNLSQQNPPMPDNEQPHKLPFWRVSSAWTIPMRSKKVNCQETLRKLEYNNS